MTKNNGMNNISIIEIENPDEPLHGNLKRGLPLLKLKRVGDSIKVSETEGSKMRSAVNYYVRKKEREGIGVRISSKKIKEKGEVKFLFRVEEIQRIWLSRFDSK